MSLAILLLVFAARVAAGSSPSSAAAVLSNDLDSSTVLHKLGCAEAATAGVRLYGHGLRDAPLLWIYVKLDEDQLTDN
jgi:hypothetical protein